MIIITKDLKSNSDDFKSNYIINLSCYYIFEYI